MQICLQLALSIRPDQRRRYAATLAAIILCQALLTDAARSESRVSAWANGQKSAVRLIAAPSGSGPFPWRVGVEIRLASGALTYWRTPGGAGVAPIFSFVDSVNVAQVDVAYPAPVRIEEEGTSVYGYRGEVTFPLHVTPSDVGQPMTLVVTLSYAVCDRICLPAAGTVGLDLPARPDPSLPESAEDIAIAALARAEAQVPQRLDQRERDIKVSITAVEKASPPAWRVVVHEEPAQDLFVEAAEGWYFETRRAETADAFLIIQAEKPKVARDAAVPVTLTLTGPDRSYEFSASLDRETSER